jgi:TIR domain
MGSKIFLSHDHQDDELARVLAIAISRITLRQLEVWFSSDESAMGGIRPGKLWIEETRTQLNQSKAIIILITPTSLNRPWTLFEGGFGAAIPDCDVIPLCIGMSTNEVSFPLAMYKCYQLADYESLKNFTSKLLQRYQINFDEEMAKPVLERAISDFTRFTQTINEKAKPFQINLADLSTEIKQHIDRRMIELVERQQTQSPTQSSRPRERDNLSYTVPISINFSDFKRQQFLEIGSRTTVQDILDNVYYMIDKRVEPFQYMRTWIIREVKHSVNLVIREVGDLIPAKFIFTAATEWEVVELSEPYKSSDSEDTDRWYKVKWR